MVIRNHTDKMDFTTEVRHFYNHRTHIPVKGPSAQSLHGVHSEL